MVRLELRVQAAVDSHQTQCHFGHQEHERRKAQAGTGPIVDIEPELLDACGGNPNDDLTAKIISIRTFGWPGIAL